MSHYYLLDVGFFPRKFSCVWYLGSYFPSYFLLWPPVAGLGTLRLVNSSSHSGPRELQQYSSNQFYGSLRNSGESGGGVRESNLCPLDAQIHYVSIFISPHYHELGGMEELACCYSARSQTGKGSRLQTTLSLRSPNPMAVRWGRRLSRWGRMSCPQELQPNLFHFHMLFFISDREDP